MVFSFNDKKTTIDAIIKGGEMAGHYKCSFKTCDNPVCTCNMVYVSFFPTEPENKNYPLSPHKVIIDIGNRESDKEKTPGKDLNFANQLIAGMDDADFRILRNWYFAIKQKQTKEASDDSIEAHFDFEAIEDQGLMESYNEVLPYGDQLIININGEDCIVFDSYCLLPDCTCTEVNLDVFRAGEYHKPGEELFFITLDYRTSHWGGLECRTGSYKTKVVRSAMENQIPGIYKRLQTRHRKLKSIYSFCREKRFGHAQQHNTTDVGMNDKQGLTNNREDSDYRITTDPSFIWEEFGIPPGLRDQFESLRSRATKGGNRIIQQLTLLIEEYPHIPHLKNYLSAAYEASGKKSMAFEENHRILREHPDYLFGKINLAYQYFDQKQYDKIPGVLGALMQLNELCPERELFHLNEVASFLRITILYFCAAGDIDEADARFELLEDLDPDHPETDSVYAYLTRTRFKMAGDRLDKEIQSKYRVLTAGHNKKIQTKTPPVFNNSEINMLYESSLDIDREDLEMILALPRDELVSDLIAVLMDSVARFEYFMGVVDKKGWQENKMSFPVHAVFLLGELRAFRGLQTVLDTFRQGDEFIEFWYGTFISGWLWEPLYYMGNDQPDLFMEFVLSPGIWKFARAEVCCSVQQIAFHQPERKDEVVNWYGKLFRSLLETPVKANIIDSDFIGFAIWDAVELRAVKLLPEIEDLYDLGYVAKSICGTFEDVSRDIRTAPKSHAKRELFHIYDRYRQVIDEEETEPPPYTPKTGRNDPCHCGSGKKYKKCCLRN